MGAGGRTGSSGTAEGRKQKSGYGAMAVKR